MTTGVRAAYRVRMPIAAMMIIKKKKVKMVQHGIFTMHVAGPNGLFCKGAHATGTHDEGKLACMRMCCTAREVSTWTWRHRLHRGCTVAGMPTARGMVRKGLRAAAIEHAPAWAAAHEGCRRGHTTWRPGGVGNVRKGGCRAENCTTSGSVSSMLCSRGIAEEAAALP